MGDPEISRLSLLIMLSGNCAYFLMSYLNIIIGLEWLPWSLGHQDGIDVVGLLLVEGILQPSEEWLSRWLRQPG